MVHVAAQAQVIGQFHAELDRCHDGRCGHCAKAVVGHAGDVHHVSDAATRPDIDRRATTGDIDQRLLDGPGQQDRVVGDAGTQAAAGAAQKQHRGHGRLAVLADALDDAANLRRHGLLNGVQRLVQHIPAGMLPGGGHHEQAQAGPGHSRVPALDDGQRIGNVCAAPAGARVGHLKVAPRR